MSIVQAHGVTTAYEIVGNGSPLVLLHGWKNTADAWLPLVPALADQYSLVLPDLPGCGKSSTPNHAWTSLDYAQWLDDFLQAVIPKDQLQRIALCGHSHGGRTILWHASGNFKIHPRVLILIGASGMPSRLKGNQRIVSGLSKIVPAPLKGLVPQSLRRSLYTHFRLESDYLEATEFEKGTLQAILHEDITPKLASIAQPTLVIWGAHDEATPLWQGESIATLLPRAKLITLDADHFPHHAFPDAVSSAIRDFLV